MEKLKAAFIFIYPAEGDPSVAPVCQGWTETPGVDLLAIGVASYEQACEAARKAVAEYGLGAVELCGGFGIQGTALIDKAVGGKARIGAVRFDLHPGLDNKSGDEIFL